MAGTTRPPSPTASRAMALVEQLREEVRFLRGELRDARVELRSTRRLVLGAYGIATAAIGALASFRFG